MKTETLVYNGSVRFIDRSIASVKYSYLLVKTLYVYLGLFEKILLSYSEPLVKPITLGSGGVVKIIEDPSGLSSELSGKNAVVSPFGSQGILGLEQDGLASNYTQIHSSYIYKYITEPRPHYAVYPYVAYGITLCEETGNPVLIVGCDIVSISAAIYLKSIGLDKPDILCSRLPSFLKKYDLKILQHINDLLPRYDTVVVSYEKYSLIHSVLDFIDYKKLVLTNTSRVRIIPVKRNINTRVVYLDYIREVDEKSVEKITREIFRDVKIIRVKSLSEAVGLLPPRRFGLIIELSS